MFPRKNGFTMTEIMISSAILGIIVLIISSIFSATYKNSTDLNFKSEAQHNITNAYREIYVRILHANEILVASGDQLRFIADIDTWPAYASAADFDNDGLDNSLDPDMDDDATSYAISSDLSWSVGYNLKDDDDDDDDEIDMVWDISLNGKQLVMDYSHNGEDWGNHRKILLTKVSDSNIFTYFGSTNDLLSYGGAAADSNGNGIVSEDEIDDAGNDNDQLDQSNEMDYIISININLEEDINSDGNIDFKLESQIMPPLLYLKRRP